MNFKEFLKPIFSSVFPKIITGIVVVFVLVFSWIRALDIHVGSDFHVFWQSGVDFFNGDSLYIPKDGALDFIYPQFAAFLFQLLALFPLNISAWLFYIGNALVLMPLSVFLIINILINYGIDKRNAVKISVVAFLLSFQYWWNNLSMFQVNYLLFCISLLGIYFLSKNKPGHSVIFFTVAAFIKIIPIFFLFYTLIYYRKIRLVFILTCTTACCLLLPSLQRGPINTYNDYSQYHEVFLQEFQNGKVITSYTNHTLKAGALKAFHPETVNTVIDPTTYTTTLTIVNCLLLLLFLLLIYATLVHSMRNERIGLSLLSCIFFFSHLASGMTWTAHLVTFVFSLIPFLIIRKPERSKVGSYLYSLTFAVLLFLVLEGSDTTGKTIYAFIRQFDVFVLLPLGLFLFYLGISIREHEKTSPKTRIVKSLDTTNI